MIVTGWVWNGPYHRQVVRQTCSTRVRLSGLVIVTGANTAVPASCARLPRHSPLSAGRPRLPVLGGASLKTAAFARILVVTVTRSGSPCHALVAYAVHHQLNDPGREPRKDDVDQLPRELRLGRSVGVRAVLGLEQPEHDGQADRPSVEAAQRSRAGPRRPSA